MRTEALTDNERKLRAFLLDLYRTLPDGPLCKDIHRVLSETHRPGTRVHAIGLGPQVCGTLIERDGTEWIIRSDSGSLVRWSEGTFEDAPPRPTGPDAWKSWPTACAQAPEANVCVRHACFDCPTCVEPEPLLPPPEDVAAYAKSAESALRRIATACGFERTHDYPLQIVADVEQRLGELAQRSEIVLKMLMVGDEAIRMLEAGGANEALELLKEARSGLDETRIEDSSVPRASANHPLGLVFPCPFCGSQRSSLQIMQRCWVCHRCHAEKTPQGRASLLYLERDDGAPSKLRLRAIVPSISDGVPPGYHIKKMEATSGAGAQPERWLVFPEAWHFEHPDRAMAIREALLHAAAARHRGEAVLPELGTVVALGNVLALTSEHLTMIARELDMASSIANLQARPVMSELRTLTLAEAQRFFPVGTKVMIVSGDRDHWIYEDVVERDAELVGVQIAVKLQRHGLWSASELFVKLPATP